MPLITKRIPFTPENPYRPQRPSTEKIIFLSCEGSVTEEEYFQIVTDVFSEIRSRIQFISVAEDEVHTRHNCRTQEQVELLSKTRPKQLVQRIESFKAKNAEKYEFEKYPEDEFWIVTDVDKNWSNTIINQGKTLLDEWNEAIALCEEKNYNYAVSNPFFEIWLLLHHDDCSDEDKRYAVTDAHDYETTSHFRDRLRTLKVPLKDKKHIKSDHYTKENIIDAITRARQLHILQDDLQPHYLATTVYILIEKITSLI